MKKSFTIFVLIVMIFLATTACSLTNLISSAISGIKQASTSVGEVATLVGSMATMMPSTLELQILDTPVPSSDIIMTDDFSDTSSGWETYSDQYGDAGYSDGGYLVKSVVKEQYMWGGRGVDLADIQVEVDATVIETVANGYDAYGIDCRLQSNGDGYGFRITSDGYIAIVLYGNGEGKTLVDWEQNDAVYTDGRANHIGAVCAGDTLQLWANGEKVAETSDSTFNSGDIALSVTGFNDGTVQVLFDNLVVKKASVRN
jgi:hypothetical protein